MKNILSTFLLLLAAVSVSAQAEQTFQFIDKNGSVIADGATITVSELTPDEFMGDFVNSGLFVKNISSASTLVRVVYEITTIDNGSLQICFPNLCNSQMFKGTYETQSAPIAEGETRDFQTEWFPTAYGRCQVTFSLEEMAQIGIFPNYSYIKIADGPKVTVVFDYPDPAGIASATQHGGRIGNAVFDLQGRRLTASQRHSGLRIVTLPGGRKVKQFIR
ncbi:MAG: hypothetical protein ACSW8D_02195 [Prevotella sp.]|jgi:hypothetical protein